MNQKAAVLLVNLGTPERPDKKAVGNFLKMFLSDSRVVEAPKLIWWFVLRFIVIPLRAKKVAHAYQSIWLKQGSPLKIISERQKEAVQNLLRQQKIPVEVYTAQTYGKLTINKQIQQLTAEGFNRFIVIPMYPQYSGSTTGAIYDQLAKIILSSRNVPDIRVIKSFYNHPDYIQALTNSVKAYWEKNKRSEKLIMSFHGIPESYVEKGDPYQEQCRATATLLAKQLQLKEEEWLLTFQSRFGPKQWLQPYTDETLIDIAKTRKSESVDIISPAFVADCLETLEELNVENRQLFLNSGGKYFGFIPCLNESDDFILFLSKIIKQELFDNNCVKKV